MVGEQRARHRGQREINGTNSEIDGIKNKINPINFHFNPINFFFNPINFHFNRLFCISSGKLLAGYTTGSMSSLPQLNSIAMR